MQFRNYKAPQKTKRNVFLGHFRLLEGYVHQRTPIAVILNGQFSTINSSRNMDFGKFWRFSAQFGKINWFHPLFRQITKSVLKIDPLRIPRQLLSRSLHNLDDYPSLNWSNTSLLLVTMLLLQVKYL